MASTSCLKRALLALLAVVAVVAVFGADDKGEKTRVSAKFVNQLPNTAIDLFWENHKGKTRKLVATLKPRGRWHVQNTFTGHGEHHKMSFLSV